MLHMCTQGRTAAKLKDGLTRIRARRALVNLGGRGGSSGSSSEPVVRRAYAAKQITTAAATAAAGPSNFCVVRVGSTVLSILVCLPIFLCSTSSNF